MKENMPIMLQHIMILVILLFLVEVAAASPMYYTFSGKIENYSHTNHDYDDAAGFIADAGLFYGADVSYIFLIDFEVQGYQKNLNGDIIYFNDNFSRNYFYSDYISGSAIRSSDNGFYTVETGFGDSEYSEYNIGVLELFYSDIILGGSSNSRISIYNIESWEIGSFARAYNYAYSSLGVKSQYLAELQISSISASLPQPVPEPSSSVLILLGVFGLLHRFNKKHNQAN